MSFDRAFADVVGVEGGFTADPRDKGNWTGGVVGKGQPRGTKFGISAAAYPALDIAALTLDAAKAIYRLDYWQRISADALPADVAELAFDAAVNQGQSAAIRLLQAAAGVTQDGVLGPHTLAALAAMKPDTLFVELWARRAVRYANDNQVTTYGLGWFRRLATIGRAALTAA
jgi:lysozyme family protein